MGTTCGLIVSTKTPALNMNSDTLHPPALEIQMSSVLGWHSLVKLFTNDSVCILLMFVFAYKLRTVIRTNYFMALVGK